MNEERWFSESAVAQKLGVTKNGLEDFRSRNLKKADSKKIGREIYLSQAALNKVLELIGSSSVDCSDCLLQKNGEPPAAVVLDLIVNRVYPNPHLLECVKPAAGDAAAERVLVRVPMNKNFRPRMILRAKPDPHHPKLYLLEGRCPRFPGRW